MSLTDLKRSISKEMALSWLRWRRASATYFCASSLKARRVSTPVSPSVLASRRSSSSLIALRASSLKIATSRVENSRGLLSMAQIVPILRPSGVVNGMLA